MELTARLEVLELKLRKLLNDRRNLIEHNADLREQLDQMKTEINRQNTAINNLKEQNKSAKLAGGDTSKLDSSSIKQELNELIQEVEHCLKLVKR